MKFISLALFLGCSQPFNVMSFNLASGAGAKYTTIENRESQHKFVVDNKVDILGMQEVDIDVRRSWNVNVASLVGIGEEYISYSFDHDIVLHEGLKGSIIFGRSLTFDKNFCDVLDGSPCDDRGTAMYGNAIFLSKRFKVDHAYVVVLPETAKGCEGIPTLSVEPWAGMYDEWNEAHRKLAPSEVRTALMVNIHDSDSRKFTVINTHLNAVSDEARANEMACIRVLVRNAANDGPVILVGDFNESAGPIYTMLDMPNVSLRLGYQESIDQIWGTSDIQSEDVTPYGIVPTNGLSDHIAAPMSSFK